MRYMVSIDWSTIPYQVLAFVFPSVDGPILALTVTAKIGASTDGTWTFLGWIEHRFLACVWWKWHSSPPFPLYGNSEVLLVQAVCEIWQKWQVAEAEPKLSLWWVSYGHSSKWDCSFCNWGLKAVITYKKEHVITVKVKGFFHGYKHSFPMFPKKRTKKFSKNWGEREPRSLTKISLISDFFKPKFGKRNYFGTWKSPRLSRHCERKYQVRRCKTSREILKLLSDLLNSLGNQELVVNHPWKVIFWCETTALVDQGVKLVI
jgi:hypothetical protein